MDEILSDFAESTDGIHRNVERVDRGLDSITTAVEESAKGVSSVAAQTSNLVGLMNRIREETFASQQISESLTAEVGRFRKV